jgi:hypothetical protein
MELLRAPDSNAMKNHRRYTTERFVDAVWRGVTCPEDPTTIGLWAHHVGTTRSPLSTLCRLLGIPARDARNFTRLFRAFVMIGGKPNELHDVLNVNEPKTLEGLFARAGLEYPSTLTPFEFLDHQRLVRNEHVLDALKRLLQERSLHRDIAVL